MSLLKLFQATAFAMAVLVLSANNGQAQQYVFSNNNVAGTSNSTTAMKVSSAGAIKVIHTYPTGGKSSGSAYFSLTPIATSKTVLGSCLFVSNGGDSTIAAYEMNLFDGTLTAVPGSPFSDGVSGAQHLGIGLAAGGSFLFAGNTNNNSISVMHINSKCALNLLTKVTVPGSPAGMKVTPDKKFLITAYSGQVDSFSIESSTGNLTELGPFTPKGAAAAVEISCDSSMVYFGDASSNTQVEAFNIASNGTLKEFDNFTNKNGQGSYNLMLSADGKHLVVSNTISKQITTLSVASDGSLSYDGTVALKKAGTYALGLTSAANGSHILVSEQGNPEMVGVLAASGSTLKEVPGSPFKVTSNGSDPAALVAVPTKACH
jgi:6-phosphogluconolactonase (cycloisomerase 2 family)